MYKERTEMLATDRLLSTLRSNTFVLKNKFASHNPQGHKICYFVHFLCCKTQCSLWKIYIQLQMLWFFKWLSRCTLKNQFEFEQNVSFWPIVLTTLIPFKQAASWQRTKDKNLNLDKIWITFVLSNQFQIEVNHKI